jgi:hypothetical protein
VARRPIEADVMRERTSLLLYELKLDEIGLTGNATGARSLSRLRGRVGVGVLPQDALVERIGFSPTRRASRQ